MSHEHLISQLDDDICCKPWKRHWNFFLFWNISSEIFIRPKSDHRPLLSLPNTLEQTSYLSRISRIIQAAFFNCSSRFSEPKWNPSCSQPGLLFQEIFNVRKLLVGWASFFFHFGNKNGEERWKPPCTVYIKVERCQHIHALPLNGGEKEKKWFPFWNFIDKSVTIFSDYCRP